MYLLASRSKMNFRISHLREKIENLCTIVGVIAFLMVIMIFIATFIINVTIRINVVYIDHFSTSQAYQTDEKFLSVALDATVIANKFKGFDISNPRLAKMMKALSPAYLRIGGTMADRLIFSAVDSNYSTSGVSNENNQNGFEDICSDPPKRNNFTMTGEQWLQLNDLAKRTGLEIIFGLNALRRFENGSWDFKNAEQLIQFSEQHDLNLSWELGNEPNAFRHQFDYYVDPTQLGVDFYTLKKLLKKYPKYVKSLLLGPDTTRPQNDHKESEIYLKNFLDVGGNIVDAITWHQYYFNGRTASLEDFLDIKNFDILKWQITKVKEISTKFNKSIWLGETSSAYGGGAPNLSNRYVATFIWLDKLGISAKFGLDVVIRQSIFKGFYALVNDDYSPAPDFWVSLLYKKLISPRVVNCYSKTSPKVRLYCHCANYNHLHKNASPIVIFGINLSKKIEKVRIEGLFPLSVENQMSVKVHTYILTSDKLDSKEIFLNGAKLKLTTNGDIPVLVPKIIIADSYVEMPPYSSAFWVMSSGKPNIC